MRKHSSRASLFLMELILAILFFSLASAVCMQLFAKAHKLSTDTQNLNIAVLKAQNAAEKFSAGKDLPLEEGFDLNWQNCPLSDAAYVLTAEISRDDSMATASIFLRTADKSQLIYSLDVRQHIPYTAGGISDE